MSAKTSDCENGISFKASRRQISIKNSKGWNNSPLFSDFLVKGPVVVDLVEVLDCLNCNR